MTNNKITDTIKTIARVTEALSTYVLFAGGRLNSLMPTAQFDQFENLDKPVMRSEQKDEAHTFWEQLSTERDEYLADVSASLMPPKAAS